MKIYKTYCFSFRLGFFYLYLTDKEKAKLKRRKIQSLFRIKAKLAETKQKELLQFLQLYYMEGQNLYYLIGSYRKVADRSNLGLIKRIHCLIKAGYSFATILSMNVLFDSQILMNFSMAENSGDISRAISLSEEYIIEKIDRKKQLASKMFYPILLTCSVVGILFFISVTLVPQFKSFFASYDIKEPVILTMLSVDKLVLFFCSLGLLFLLTNKLKIATRYLIKLPVFKYLAALRFQHKFFSLYLNSIRYDIPLDKLIDTYILNDENETDVYYLSTISLQIKQGIQISEALNQPLIMNKYKNLFVMSFDRDKEQTLLKRIIKDNQREQQDHYNRVANISSIITMIFVGVLVFLLGYLMMIPLQNLSNVI